MVGDVAGAAVVGRRRGPDHSWSTSVPVAKWVFYLVFMHTPTSVYRGFVVDESCMGTV